MEDLNFGTYVLKTQERVKEEFLESVKVTVLGLKKKYGLQNMELLGIDQIGFSFDMSELGGKYCVEDENRNKFDFADGVLEFPALRECKRKVIGNGMGEQSLEQLFDSILLSHGICP